MKKNYFMLAATTMMLAACAQTDVVTDIPEPQQQAISFETFVDKATRVSTESYDLSSHHDQYYVWGYKNTSSVLVFNEEEVNSSDNSYGTDLKYWDKAASAYYFYATAPSAFTFVPNGGQNASYFTLSDVELKGTNFTTALSATANTTLKINNGDIDYMIAYTDVPTDGNDLFEFVNFNFKHILSRLNVTIKNSTRANIVLNSITVSGLKTTATEFNSSLSGLDRWNPSQTTVNYTSIGGTVPATAQYALECLLIPQTVAYEVVPLAGKVNYSAPHICVNYNIQNGTDSNQQPTYENFIAYYNLAALFGATSTDDNTTIDKDETKITFSEAHQSTLNITFSPQGIEFSTTTSDWVAENTTTNGKTIN